MQDKFYELAIAPSGHYDAFLSRILESGPAIECDGFAELNAKSGVIVHSSEENLEGLLKDLQNLASELDVGLEYSLKQKANQDWITEYKKGVMPVKISSFYIRPPWHEAHTSEIGHCFDVVIEPSLAFGTGHHESTALAIELLESLDLTRAHLLDVGCGSGILGICASHLGAIVSACDIDELAIEVCDRNFKLNGAKLERIALGSLAEFDVLDFDVIVLNIQKEVIKMLYNELLVSKSGTSVILSGILADDEAEILEHFYGFETKQILKRNEWIAFNLIKK